MTAKAPAPRPGASRSIAATIDVPRPDTVVVADGVRFEDDVWDVTPLSGRPGVRWLKMSFDATPAHLRDDLKHFIYLLLTTDTPLDRFDRAVPARRRLTPSTVTCIWRDLQPFIKWFTSTSKSSLDQLDDHDFRDYAKLVQAEPVVQGVRGRRLFAVTRLWLYAPYLRQPVRLRQPFWESEGIEEVLGRSEWTAENKSLPVHPMTMSALLVWCLRILEDAPVLVARHSMTDSPTRLDAGVEGTLRWVSAATGERMHSARRLVACAAFVVVSYLTGMRADEVLALQRGCCTPTSGAGFAIRGLTFKSAIENGRSIPAGVERDHPWMAIKPVADAIAVMEALHPADLLFPAGILLRAPRITPDVTWTVPVAERSAAFKFLQRWANTRAAELNRPQDVIPADPDGNITLRRLRRTLAWFIYRRPRGRVALGIQYGHLHAATTDGYGSRVSVGLRDLFPIEEALALGDTLSQAADELQTGPTVSGPAATRYQAALTEFSHRYGGLTLTARQAADLAANPDLRIYDGPEQSLACCFDPRKALCRRTTPGSRPSTTPDLTACDSRCVNIARTDRHIEVITAEIHQLRDEIVSPLTPEPIRPRLELRADRHQAIVDAHRKETRRDSI